MPEKEKPDLFINSLLLGEFASDIIAAVTETVRESWSKKVKAGMARAKNGGARYGRPQKSLTEAELELVAKLRAEGKGWRRCALTVSKWRGAFQITDPERRRKLTVSHSTIRRQILRM